MIRRRELWDVCEAPNAPWPSYGLGATVRMMQALRKLQGAPMDTHTEAGPGRGEICRIALPVGTKEEFEEMTGYRLTHTETGT